MQRLQAELQAAQDEANVVRQQAGGGPGGGSGRGHKRRADGQAGEGPPAAKRGAAALGISSPAGGEAAGEPGTPAVPAAGGRRGPMRGARGGQLGPSAAAGGPNSGGEHSRALQQRIRGLKGELKTAELCLKRVRVAAC